MQWPEYILSSVTPIFDKTSEGYFYNDLSNAFLNILNTANDAKTINSLAIPLLATGNYGAPVNRCAIALVDAIINFSNKKVSSECHIREIHLVNIEDSTTKAMIDCLESSMVESRGLIRRLSDDSTNNFDSKINLNLMDNISDVGDDDSIDSCDRCRQRIRKRFLSYSKLDNTKYCLGCKIFLNENKNSNKMPAFDQTTKNNRESKMNIYFIPLNSCDVIYKLIHLNKI